MVSLKDQGNEEFQKENYLKAAAIYTKAIKEDPQNAVLFSNRSAALLKLSKVTKAMEDAEMCISLKPEWEKGYFRKAAVLEAQDKLQEALEVYQSATKLLPDGAANKELSNKIRTLTKLIKSKTSSALKEDTLESVLLAAVGAAEEGVRQQLSEFCRQMAGLASDSIAESGAAFVPSVHFLAGPAAEGHEDRETHIQAPEAFASPEVYGDFVRSMQAVGGRLAALGVLAVVPKASVSFPQLWIRKGWPTACGSKQQQGVFVQLETRAPGGGAGARRLCWFVPVRVDKSASPPVSLNPEDFGLLPNLLM